jgi:hypothetical protein
MAKTFMMELQAAVNLSSLAVLASLTGTLKKRSNITVKG